MANTITRSFAGYTFQYATFDENRNPTVKEIYIPIRDREKALRKAKTYGALLDEDGVFINETREMKVEDFYALSTLVGAPDSKLSEEQEADAECFGEENCLEPDASSDESSGEGEDVELPEPDPFSDDFD